VTRELRAKKRFMKIVSLAPEVLYDAKLKIKKGDNVVVISGRDKGKQGEVLQGAARRRTAPDRAEACMIARHSAKRDSRGRYHREGGCDPHLECGAYRSARTGKPTRVGYKFLDRTGARSALPAAPARSSMVERPA
jgi:large subunit ribosomal protein L24